MELLHTLAEHCACCGAPIELIVDASIAEQVYVEDCEVCCQPLIVQVDASDPELPQVRVTPENG